MGRLSFSVNCCPICSTSLTLLLVVVDPILSQAHTLLGRSIFYSTILVLLNKEGHSTVLTSKGYLSLLRQLPVVEK